VWSMRRSISGINFFDTANVYGATPTFDRPGAPPATEREPAEQILGRALVGRRDDVVIATKSGERRFDPAAGLSRRYIIHQVEHSLRRLGTDHIDLYYAHFPDPDTPPEQTLVVYDDLVRQGKLRYVALPACQLPTGSSPCTSLSANWSIMLRSYTLIVSILSPWMLAMPSRRRVRVSGASMSMA
jgi:aryl-alcohol dehydrogenase-like predicted oxidoreductase